MKYSNVLLLSLVVVSLFASAQTKSVFTRNSLQFNEDSEDTEFRFINYCLNSFWKGFMSGFYHSSAKKFKVSDDCFGQWIEEDATEINLIGKQIKELDFMNMKEDDASAAAVDVVELFFK